jgi:hypothetical protein
LWARSVVQADGDVVTYIDRSALEDPDRVRAHADALSAWFVGANATMIRLRSLLGAVEATISLLVAAAVAVRSLTTQQWWMLVLIPLVPLLVQALAPRLTGWALRKVTGLVV